MLKFIAKSLLIVVIAPLGALTAQEPTAEFEPTTVEIDYESAVYEFGGEKKIVKLKGPITIRTNNLLVTCDEAEIQSSRNTRSEASGASDSSLGTIDYIFARGNVEIIQEGSKALAGQAEIFPAEKKLVLEDNPRIIDPYGTVSGHRIVFLQGDRRIRIESGEEKERSKIRINDVKDVGFLMGEEPVQTAEPPAAEEE